MDQEQITIVVAVIKNENGELLLTQRHEPEIPEIHGKWEFVGGGIGFGEDPIEAIKREVLEEIGVKIEIIRLLPKVISDTQEFSNRQLQVLVLTYECKIMSGVPQANKEENIGDIKYIPLDGIEKLDTFQNVHDTVKLLRSLQ